VENTAHPAIFGIEALSNFNPTDIIGTNSNLHHTADSRESHLITFASPRPPSRGWETDFHTDVGIMTYPPTLPMPYSYPVACHLCGLPRTPQALEITILETIRPSQGSQHEEYFKLQEQESSLEMH
jgi:hypothetical protein